MQPAASEQVEQSSAAQRRAANKVGEQRAKEGRGWRMGQIASAWAWASASKRSRESSSESGSRVGGRSKVCRRAPWSRRRLEFGVCSGRSSSSSSSSSGGGGGGGVGVVLAVVVMVVMVAPKRLVVDRYRISIVQDASDF